jgi:hypothetical protein
MLLGENWRVELTGGLTLSFLPTELSAENFFEC